MKAVKQRDEMTTNRILRVSGLLFLAVASITLERLRCTNKTEGWGKVCLVQSG